MQRLFYVSWLLSVGCLLLSLGAAANPKIQISFPDFRPYSYIENGEQMGVCPQIAKQVFRHDFDIQVNNYPWRRAQKLLEHGKLDALVCLLKNKSREQRFIFSEPIFSINMVLITHKQSKIKVSKVSDLKKYNGVTVRGDSSRPLYDPQKLHLLTDIKSVLRFIAFNRAEIGFLPERMYDSHFEQLSDEVKKMLKKNVISSKPVFIAFSKQGDFTTELNKINGKIAQLKKLQGAY